MRTARPPPLQNPKRGPHGGLRVHRRLVHPQSQPFRPRLSFTDQLRKDSANRKSNRKPHTVHRNGVAPEREQRVAQALSELEQLSAARAQARNHSQRQREARASTTDPQARVMKLADGGLAPAHNLHFATDTETRLIVRVGATNAGNDSQQLEPMQDQLQRRTALLPRQHLVDGGYMNFPSVERAAARGIEVFSPLRENRDFHIDPLLPQPRDSPALAAYRLRMASAEGQAIYKERAATAETINADLKTC